jgi:HTH-type transcriptional regulator/antitoxin HigA
VRGHAYPGNYKTTKRVTAQQDGQVEHTDPTSRAVVQILIRTEADYNNALARVAELMDAAPDSEAGAELDVLATLVEAYEAKNFPIESPDPIEAIKFRMEQMGIKRRDLEPLLGGRSRVSEVMSRKRSLSITQIRKLHEGLRIPYENLLGAA